MTHLPATVSRNTPAGQALHRMQARRIRHLPVMEAGKLVGVVSERDLSAWMLANPRDELSVGELMTSHPYLATSDTPLAEIVRVMAVRKYGCAVVLSPPPSERIVGIFTTTDALRLLAGLLETENSPVTARVELRQNFAEWLRWDNSMGE
jgi:acetoin utilization protein AcuB